MVGVEIVGFAIHQVPVKQQTTRQMNIYSSTFGFEWFLTMIMK